MAKHPLVSWAQRSSETDASKNIVFLSIEIQDAVNVKLDLTPTHLTFSAMSSDSDDHDQYDLNLEFYDEIDPENSRKHEAGNAISLVLRKKTLRAEYWPRLLKDKVKLHYVKTDFDKWVDEDEQEEAPEENDDMANMMNMGAGMGGAGGFGGAGGPDFSQLLGQAGGAGGDFDFSKFTSQIGEGELPEELGDFDNEDEGEEAEEEAST